MKRPALIDATRSRTPAPAPQPSIPLVAFRTGRWGWTQWHVDTAVHALRPLCGMLVVSSATSSEKLAAVDDWPSICVHCRELLLRQLERPGA